MNTVRRINTILNGKRQDNKILLSDAQGKGIGFLEVRKNTVSVAHVNKNYRKKIIEKIRMQIGNIRIVKAFFRILDKETLINEIAVGTFFKPYTLIILDTAGTWDLVQKGSCCEMDKKIEHALFSYQVKDFFLEDFWQDIANNEQGKLNSYDTYPRSLELITEKINKIEKEIQASVIL
jgi:hypothetical protein